jgi:hypothetical protein
MLELKEKDIISFYDDVQKIIGQNLASNVKEQNIEEICNAAKQWLRGTDNNKSSISLPLFILSMESLVRQRSASLLKNKVEPEFGLSYLNGDHNNLSLELTTFIFFCCSNNSHTLTLILPVRSFCIKPFLRDCKTVFWLWIFRILESVVERIETIFCCSFKGG